MRPKRATEPYASDASARPMSIEQWIAYREQLADSTVPLTPRAIRIMRSLQWGDLQPTRFTWDLMLTMVIQNALLSESVRKERERLESQNVRVEMRAGCKVYTVAAWEKAPKPRKRKAKR